MRNTTQTWLFFMLYSLVLPSVATTPLYHEGAAFGSALHQRHVAADWLKESNASLVNTMKTCDALHDNCREVNKEQEFKMLIQAAHEKTSVQAHDADMLAVQKNQGDAMLPDTVPGIGYCKTTDCLYSKATADEANSLAPLEDWLALSNVTHDFDGAQVLTGELSHCRDTLGRYSQCCGVARGWGQDVHLAHCTQDEKILSQQRAKGLCILAGSRCQEKALGQCLVYEKFYCCYASSLLKEVREGVLTQLHLGFGKKHHPHCHGISLNQLQRLDFTKLTLKEAIKPPTVPMSDTLSASLNDNEVTS